MTTTVHDPVCGMDINLEDAAGTSEYEGVTYYFCSSGCKQAFDADPGKYAGAAAAPAAMPETPPIAQKPQKRWWEFWK